MKKVLSLVIVLSVTILSGFVFSQSEEPVEKKLSLKDAIYQALKNNLDLQVQKTGVQSNWQSLRIANSIYIPTLTANYQTSNSLTPSADYYDGVNVVEDQSKTSSMSISELLPLGGTLRFSFYTQRQDTNSLKYRVDPTINTYARFDLSQPLLKNFGLLPTNYDIYVNRNNHKISKLQLEEYIIQLVYNVESAYWELVYAHQNLQSAKMALERAKDLLRQNEVKKRVGTIAPIEVLSSKASVARNESTVIAAERSIQSREENLKSILNMSKEDIAIVPMDTPEVKPVPVNLNEFLLEALENRPDIKRQKINLKTYHLGVRYYRNQTLPDLQLNASYYTYGQGGTLWNLNFELDPQDPNFRTVLVEKSFSDSVKDVIKMINKNYSFGIRLQIPLGFKRERAQLARARINLKQAMLELEKTENDIYTAVKNVIKELESNRKLVEANKIALELEGENLRAEEKKLSVGLSTNFEVQSYQERFANAETTYLRSVIDYNLTLASINQALARTFKSYDIKLDDVYEK